MSTTHTTNNRVPVVADLGSTLASLGVTLVAPPATQRYKYPIATAIAAGTPQPDDWVALADVAPITPGLTMIFAATGLGKTVLAANLAGELQQAGKATAFITFGESEGVSNSFIDEQDVADAIAALKVPVIIIDSLRLVPYDLTGAAASRGVSTKFFSYLTELDNAAVNANIAIIALMNPLSGSDDKLEGYMNDIESSVMSVITLTGVNQGNYKHRRFGRKSRPLGEIAMISTVGEGIADDSDVLVGHKVKREPTVGMDLSVRGMFG